MKTRKTNKSGRPLADPDNPFLTASAMKRAKRFHELPVAMQKGLLALQRRGRPPIEAPKKQITFRFEAGLVDHLRKSTGYNTKIETILLKAWNEQRI